MTKGLFLVTDIAFALVIGALMLGVAFEIADVGQADAWSEDAHHKMAEDALAVLDANGTIARVAGMSEALGEATLLGALRELLPPTIAANVTFTIYDDEDGDLAFDLRDANPVYSVQLPSDWSRASFVVAKRVYSKYDDADPSKDEFGVVEMRLWTVGG